DLAPTIEFAGPIKSATRGAMTLTYRIEDDYGATSAEAELAMPDVPGAHPLYEMPKLPLAAPANHARSATVTATRDISEHPFARPRDDKALRHVVDYLWAMALHIEDGNTTQAERELKAAQERLREALERGASPEEIARLTKELRQAMTNFLKSYQDAMGRNGK